MMSTRPTLALLFCSAAFTTALVHQSHHQRLQRPIRAAEEPTGLGVEAPTTTYPACSDEEVIELLDKVPVFSLADEDGNSAVVNDGDSKWLEFYCDPELAVMRKKQFGQDQLRVTAQSLGRAHVAYAKAGEGDIRARFMADPRELASARQIILRGSGAEAAASGNLTAQELLDAYKLVDADLRFAKPSDVPLFSIEQLALAAGDGPGMRPWFFSMKDLIEQWRNACESDASFEQGEVQILSLDEMLRLMRVDAPTDHRARMFIPSKAALKAIGAA